jgi:hypothetical protein
VSIPLFKIPEDKIISTEESIYRWLPRNEEYLEEDRYYGLDK